MNVRELNGTLAHEHPGHLGMLVTTSRMALKAEQLAVRSGIEIVARRPREPDGPVRYEAGRISGQAPTATPSTELP